jgi:hypothetical protein
MIKKTFTSPGISIYDKDPTYIDPKANALWFPKFLKCRGISIDEYLKMGVGEHDELYKDYKNYPDGWGGETTWLYE